MEESGSSKDPDSICQMRPSAFNMIFFLFNIVNSFTEGSFGGYFCCPLGEASQPQSLNGVINHPGMSPYSLVVKRSWESPACEEIL